VSGHLSGGFADLALVVIDSPAHAVPVEPPVHVGDAAELGTVRKDQPQRVAVVGLGDRFEIQD